MPTLKEKRKSQIGLAPNSSQVTKIEKQTKPEINEGKKIKYYRKNIH